MKIYVRVIPQAKRAQIRQEDTGLKVYLTAPAVDGKANKALLAVLADFYGVRKSRIQIIKGLKSRDKTIMIEGI